MKIRQARKIYYRFYNGKYKKMPYKWNSFIKAQNLFVKKNEKK